MKEKKKNRKYGLIALALLIVLLPLGWFLGMRLEGTAPQISLVLESDYIGRSQPLTLNISDAKSGIRRIWIGLLKNGHQAVVYQQDFASAGVLGGGKMREKALQITLEPARYGFSDGPATLRIGVWDYSWRNWWHGNRRYVEKSLVIDTQPPRIEVISRAHNITPGGAALAIYRSSEPCRQSGVQVGNIFFPGQAGLLKGQNVFAVLFALGYDQGRGTPIFVKAVDRAGNSTTTALAHHIRRKTFRKDTIDISDGFLDRKLPEFRAQLGQGAPAAKIDQFIKINRDLRRANYETIVHLARHSAPQMRWKGTFLRLPKSARRAGFGDHRTYRYHGKIIDHEVHLGVDLASVAHSPVPAANSGEVVFAGPLGIYGNTVILDHGLGLFSMYSHLSRIAVQKSMRLSRGQILGRTGSTGLAGGDHLHFGILIHNTFVNPVEWWDRGWIKNNITAKIARAKSLAGQQ